MLASFGSLTKTCYSYCDYTEKHAEWPTAGTSINQEERRRDETPAHTLTFSHWWHQSASNSV